MSTERLVNTDNIAEQDLGSFLLAGQTGSGKSHLVHKLIDVLESRHSPKQLKYALFDMKRIEFHNEGEDYRQEYLLFGVVLDPELALERLEYLARIADMRLRMKETEPAIFIYIEECDIAMIDQKRFDTALINIISKAKQANMKLVYSSSRLGSKDACSDELLRAFDTYLVGQLAGQTDADRFGVGNPDVVKECDFRLIQN